MKYVDKNSWLHSLNPLSKIAWATLILIAALIFSNFYYLAGIFLSVLFVAVTARIIRETVPMLKGLFIFASILFLMQVLFYPGGTVLFHLIPAGNGYLGVTDQGIMFGLSMSARMLAIVTSFLVFLSTTRTEDLTIIMVEKMKIPYDYAFMMLTAIRFIPTFINEVQQISQAQTARGFAIEGWNPVKKIKAYLPIVVPLVLLSLKKAERLALAMETRGYGIGKRTYLREPQFAIKDGLVTVACILLVGAGIFARIKGYGV